jgi:16S rRNA (guanine527-N7)-methyltransferase
MPFKARVLDIGTGGGFPGLPLAIARPDIYATLIDSISKKIKITDMFAKHTGIKSIKTMATRAEEMQGSGKYDKQFDVIVSRAVAKIPSIISWVIRMIKPGGTIILWKGGDISEEIESALMQFKKLEIKVQGIDLLGVDYFKNEDKKLVFCKFRN